MIVGKWITRFSETGKKEEFQLDGEAPTTIAVMKQNHYPVKMGIDSDLGCTVKKKKKHHCSIMKAKCPLFFFLFFFLNVYNSGFFRVYSLKILNDFKVKQPAKLK